ncbi:MAG: aspartate aminotransferase family protein [Bacteroidales bacterium]|nr:aspartate aminotransferase family protein [Bacteroidales bacterium]
MQTLKSLFLRHIGQTSPEPMMLEVQRAEGCWLYGPAGERWLDLISGVSVSNAGHSNPHIVDAVRKQASDYMHLMVYGELIQGPQVEYAALLTSLLPDPLKVVYFVNSGSEAVEGAIKLARRYTGRSGIISFRNGYHGSTMGALSIQGSEVYKSAFRPLMPDVMLLDFNSTDQLSLITELTAAVVIEPVQGEGGVRLPSEGYLEKLRERCNKTGALLVFDEIQTGFGRIGSLFATTKYGVVPDIILLAKALGGGMPLGAFISSGAVMSTLTNNPALGHITTFGGHPVSCAAGMASLNYLLDKNLAESATARGERIKASLDHPMIREIRGEGLFFAVELTDSSLVPRFIRKSPGNGILVDYFLFCDSAFRIAPPLIITDKEIDYACESIHKTLDSL